MSTGSSFRPDLSLIRRGISPDFGRIDRFRYTRFMPITELVKNEPLVEE
jgi:hypothetical protein